MLVSNVYQGKTFHLSMVYTAYATNFNHKFVFALQLWVFHLIKFHQRISGRETIGDLSIHAEYRAAPAALGVDIGRGHGGAAHGEIHIILIGAMQHSQFHKSQLGMVPSWVSHNTTQYPKVCCKLLNMLLFCWL